MDGEISGTVNDQKRKAGADLSLSPPLHEANPPSPQCPDCGGEFAPGHMCREAIEREVMQARAAFQIAIATIVRVKNLTKVWRRGDEVNRIKEIGVVCKKALDEIQELVYKEKDELNGFGPSGNSKLGSV